MASTCRPVTRVDVRAAAVATISVTVPAGLCRKRVSLISPARSLPSRQTRTPLPPNSTNRACNNAPLFPVDGRQTAPASTQPWSPPPTESAGKGSQAALLKAGLLEMCECCRMVKPAGDAVALSQTNLFPLSYSDRPIDFVIAGSSPRLSGLVLV